MNTKNKLLMVLALVGITSMNSTYALDDLYGRERTESRAESLAKRSQARHERKESRRMESLTSVKLISKDLRIVSFEREDPSSFLTREALQDSSLMKVLGTSPSFIYIEDETITDDQFVMKALSINDRVVVMKLKEGVTWSNTVGGTVVVRSESGVELFKVVSRIDPEPIPAIQLDEKWKHIADTPFHFPQAPYGGWSK